MTKETLKSEIQAAIPQLFQMVEETCTNTLSENLVYLVSEIKNSQSNFSESQQAIIDENNRKTPISFDKALEKLTHLHENLYDINVYIHKAEKERTIVDIRFYAKSSLRELSTNSALDEPPMLHCKISRPLYSQKTKFDLNWVHGGIKHDWKLFWYRRKLKKEIAGIKNGG